MDVNKGSTVEGRVIGFQMYTFNMINPVRISVWSPIQDEIYRYTDIYTLYN